MENLTTNQALGIGALAGGMLAVALIIVFAFYALLVIALWKLFTKAGVAGWKSLIPIYNIYKMCQIIGISFWIYIIGIPFVLGVISGIISNDKVDTFLELIYYIFIDVYVANKLAKAYGKGTGFMIGLILFPSIFELVLAFGPSKYVGNYKEA